MSIKNKLNDVHISVINTFELLKKDIINSDGKINIPGLLYILAIPTAIFSVFLFIESAVTEYNNPKTFHIHDLLFGLLMMVLMLCKIPYFFDKPIALLQFIVFSALWGIAAIILTMAYLEK